jgi:hypothetical protein
MYSAIGAVCFAGLLTARLHFHAVHSASKHPGAFAAQ